MKYADKLRDPRWLQFKDEYIEWRLVRHDIPRHWCQDCGEDTHGGLHLHHTVYYLGREPWDYDFEEMRLYCETCHKRIHDLEEDFRNFIRSICSHQCYELRYVLDALIEADEKGVLKVALAHAKNAIRRVSYRSEEEGEILSVGDILKRMLNPNDSEQ